MFYFLEIKIDSLWIKVISNENEIEKLSLLSENFFIEEGYPKKRRVPYWLRRLEGDLRNYFSGQRVDFGKYPLKIANYSVFSQKVWREVKKIPYGEVRSYKWIGKKLNTRGYRAIGRILSLNPFPLLIPCHRVVKKNGSLGGFSQGEEIKKKLLEIEGVFCEGGIN